MLEPVLRSPLHTFNLSSQAREIDDSCGVWANEIPQLGYISFRGDASDAAFAEKVRVATGIALPVEPCSFSVSAGVKVLWISPDEWLMVFPRRRLQELMTELKTALAGIRCQVVDNSGGYTQVLLRGRNALDVLRHASVYDFASLSSGRVVGTTFGKAFVYAHRSPDGFCLVMRRSFADYIWSYLVRSAVPYGLGIALIEAAAYAQPEVAA
jgi:sarcosine oxidase, subunit gamma